MRPAHLALPPPPGTRPSVGALQPPYEESGHPPFSDDGVQEEQLPRTAQASLQTSTAVTTTTVPSTVTTPTAASSVSTTPQPTPPRVDPATSHPGPPPNHHVGSSHHVDYHHHHHPSAVNMMPFPLGAASTGAPAPPPQHQGDPEHHIDYHHHHHPSLVAGEHQTPESIPPFAVEQLAHLPSPSPCKPVQLLKFDFSKLPPQPPVDGGGGGRGDVAAKQLHGPVPSLLPQNPNARAKLAVLPLLHFGRTDVSPAPAPAPAPAPTDSGGHNDHHTHIDHHHRGLYSASSHPTTISPSYPRSYPYGQDNPQPQHQQKKKYRFLPLASLLPPQSKKKKYPLLRLCDPPPVTDASPTTRTGVVAHAHLDTRLFPGPSRIKSSRRKKMQRSIDTNLILTSDEDQSDLDSTLHTDHTDPGDAHAATVSRRSPFRGRSSIRPSVEDAKDLEGPQKAAKPHAVDRATSPIATLVPFNAVERLEAERELELMHALDDLDAQVESALLRRRRAVSPSNRYDASEGASIVNRAAEHRSVINKVLAEAQSYRGIGLSPAPASPAPRGLHSAEADAILAAAEAPPASLFKATRVTHTESRAAAGPGPELSRLRDEWSRVEQLRHAQAPNVIQQHIDAMVPSSKQPGYHDWRTSAAPPAQEAQPLPYTNRSLDGAGFIESAGPAEQGGDAVAGRRSESPARAATLQEQRQQYPQQQEAPSFAPPISPSPQHHRHHHKQPPPLQHPGQQQQHYQHHRHHRSSPGSSLLRGGPNSPRGDNPSVVSFSGVHRQHSGRHPLSQSMSSAGSFGGDFIHVQDLEMDPKDSIFGSDSDLSDDDSGRGGREIFGGSGGRSQLSPGFQPVPVPMPAWSGAESDALYTIDDSSPPISDDDGHAGREAGADTDAGAAFQVRRAVTTSTPFPADSHQIARPSDYVDAVSIASSSGAFAGAGTAGTSVLGEDRVLESIRMQLGAASAQLQSAEDADAALEAEMRDLSGLTSAADESHGGGGGGSSGGGVGDQTMAFEGLSYLGDVSGLNA